MRKLARQASLIVGRNNFLNPPDALVPELSEMKGARVVTYGWIMLINVFTREFLTNLAIAAFSNNPAVCLLILCFIYGFLCCMLCYLRPYQSQYICFMEGFLTGILCLLAWSGAMADLMYKSRNYKRKYVDELWYIDFLIVLLSITCVVTLVL